MKNKTKEIWILSYRTFSETCVSVEYVCLGWTLEIISTFHNLVALHEPCRVRQFQIWCPLFWCPFFEFYQRRSINRRSPTIKMVSPKLFVYPLYELLLISCWFPLLRGHVEVYAFLSSFAHVRHYMDCLVTGWSTDRCL